jgi:hypothetical protein
MWLSQYVFRCCCGMLIAGLLGGSIALPQPPQSTAAQILSAAEKDSVNQFAKQARDYLSKEHALPAQRLKPSSDVATLDKKRMELREAVRQSRPDAKQGDLFTPGVATVFRRLLAQTMAGPDGAKIKASLNHAEPGAPVELKVNKVYPNGDGQPIQSMPPTLLQNLPVLPKGLEYRLAGKTLALRDTDANLTVDFLPHALP